MNAEENGQSVSAELRALLVCPVDHGPLLDSGENLICSVCHRVYPVEDGIPNMLVGSDL